MTIWAVIFEGRFFHGEHLRWNLGWPTPNYAGSFLATLIPWCWWLEQSIRPSRRNRPNHEHRGPIFGSKRSIAYFSLLATEAIGFYLLARTYSRGGLVALLIAGCWVAIAEDVVHIRARRSIWLGRGLVLGAVIFGTGFSTRLDFSLMATDGAVLNRLELWRTGLDMLAAAPWHGWGAGEAGRAFMNWFQPIHRTEGYATMVNSYLHVGVEFGVPVLSCVLMGISALLSSAWPGASAVIPTGTADTKTQAPRRNYDGTERATACRVSAGASLLAWAVANGFTTLWTDPKLWIIPGLGAIVLLVSIIRNPARSKNRANFAVIAGGPILLTSGLIVFPIAPCGGNVWRAAPGSGNTVILSVPSAPWADPSQSWASVDEAQIWPDPSVLGPTPGKEVRRWLETLSPGTRIVVHSSEPVSTKWAAITPSSIVFFGKHAARLSNLPASPLGQVILIHPCGPPPTTWSSALVPRGIVVLIPEIDQDGESRRWADWALANAAHIIVTPKVGQDVRSAWPDIMKVVKLTNGTAP